MKIRDLNEPIGPRRCMYNVPWPDDYSSGESRGYEKAKKEYEEKLKNREQELMARGFIPDIENHLVSKSETLNPSSVLRTSCGDIPKQNNIPTGSKLCGYIEIDGTYHKCESCEHEKNIRQIIWGDDYFRERYFNTPASFFDNMPRGMLQEEYFAMKDLGFVKISSFKDAPTKMIAFFYGTLTYKQTDLIYPR